MRESICHRHLPGCAAASCSKAKAPKIMLMEDLIMHNVEYQCRTKISATKCNVKNEWMLPQRSNERLDLIRGS